MILTGKFNRAGESSSETRLPTNLEEIMSRNALCISMDTTVGEAIATCVDRGIRHLPVLSDDGKLVGILTDRDLRRYLSPRMGTISESESDREPLSRRAHLIMIRRVVTAGPETTIAEGAALLLEHRIGCLPIIDQEKQVIGIVTKSDFLRVLAQSGRR